MLRTRDKKVLQKIHIRILQEDAGFEYYYDDVTLRKINDIRALIRVMTYKLAVKAKGLWRHVDLNVLSTRSLLAVNYRQPGGSSWCHLEERTKAVLSSGKVIGMNVTIHNPDIDPGMRYAKRIIKYLQAALSSLSMRGSQTAPSGIVSAL